MSAQIDGSANLNLPPPVIEAPAGRESELPVEQQPGLNPEAAREPAKEFSPPASAAAGTAIPPQLVQPAGTTNDVSSTSTIATPAVADDADLIEKEWVNKAKAIIEGNKEDPYQQSQQISAVKADYLQKRYNKVLKPAK